MARYVCDRWADEKERVAIFADDGEGGRETYTYWRLRNAANATANALRERGVERGDRSRSTSGSDRRRSSPISPVGSSARSRSR